MGIMLLQCFKSCFS